MAKFPLVGPSYTSQSVNADCQSTVNLYPEVIESGSGNAQIVLYPAPGLKSFTDLSPITPPPPTCVPSYYKLAGSSVVESGGNTVTTTITVLNPMKIGDVVFFSISTTHLFAEDNAVTAVSDNIASVSSQIGSRLQITSGSSIGLTLQVFKLTLTQGLVAGGSYAYTVTYNHGADTVQGVIVPVVVRCISDEILAENEGLFDAPAGPAVYGAFPVTTTVPAFVMSFLEVALGNHVQPDYIPASFPFGVTGQFIAIHYAAPDTTVLTSPPGTYGGSYQAQFGAAVQVAIKNVAFGLET